MRIKNNLRPLISVTHLQLWLCPSKLYDVISFAASQLREFAFGRASGVLAGKSLTTGLLLLGMGILAHGQAYKQPEVQTAMATLFAHQGYGQRNTESAFVVHGHRPDMTAIIKPLGENFTNDHERFQIGVGDTAIVHTHPDRDNPRPSLDDMAIADKYGVEMYTVTSQGVYFYAKGMKHAELVITRNELF